MMVLDLQLKHRGSRISAYNETAYEDEFTNKSGDNKFMSITAMPFYKYISLEELRCKDYQLVHGVMLHQ